jgi:hypothetical protein
MPRILSQEEIDAQFGGGFRADVVPAGLGTRFGAAIDRSQAGLLGIGEAAGLPVGDLRRENQFEQQQSMQRYFRDNPNEPQSYKDVEGVGSALRYVRGLAVDSSPELLTSLATGGAGALMGLGTAGRIGLAAAANYPAGLGDILQNQREEAGQTNFGVAGLLAVPYAAADMVGLDAALASGKMMRTGIKRLDEMRGFGGAAARTGANVALNAPIEGASETFQELVNQTGRMAVNPRQTLFNPEANERYLESFVGGAALGGAASGLMGGWRRSEQYQAPQQETDLLNKQTQQPEPQQYGLVTQPAPLQQRIDQQLGIGVRTTPKDYAKQFAAAYDEPSGQYSTDPITGLEKQLSVGEYQQLTGASLDLTESKPAEAAAATAAAAKIERDPKDLFIRDTLKVIPNQYSRQLFDIMAESGVDPQSDLMAPIWNYAAQKYMGKGRYEKAVQLMDEAIINARKGAPSGIPTSTGMGTAGGVGVGGAVVPGTVGAAGSTPSFQGTVGGTTAGAGAPLQQAGVLPDTSGQPSTAVVNTAAPVVTNQPVDLTAPPASTSKFRRAPKPMTVLEAANAAKAAQAQQTETQRPQESAPQPVVDERQVLLQRIFGERNGDIIFDVIGMGMSEPDAAAKYGLKRASIQKIAGATGADARAARVAQARTELGLTDEQIRNAFAPPEQDVLGTAVEREIFGQTQPSAISEGEAIEGGLENFVNTAGAGTSEVEGFTKLQKEIDATLEALAAETDEAKLEELNAKLAEQIVKVRAVEKRAQAEVRATAGKDTSTQVGETDAVQVESTTGVSVQSEAETGQGVGKQVRRTEKPASKGQVTVQGQAKEQVNKGQVLWNNLVAKTPGLVPYEQLTTLEQDYLTDLAVRTNGKPVVAKEMGLQQLLTKEPITIEGETRIIDEQVTTQVAALPAPQVERLEQHYGAKRGTAEFLEKVQADITKYVTQGAEAVAGAIRSIIKAMAEGVLAMGIVFNPNITKDAFTLNVAKTFEQTIEVTQAVPAVAKAQMSPTAQSVYEAMAPVAMKSGKWFMVADKPNGMLHIFKEDGSHALSDPTLYGKDTGDVMEAVSSLKGGAKITPAGKFTLKARPSTYAGGQELILVESKDYTGYIAIHAADTSDASENRLGRLNTPTAADNRVSYGCINTKHDTFINEIAPNIANLDGGMVFVVPDAQEQAAQMFAAETRTETRTEGGQGAKGVAAATVVGKEENLLFGKDLPTVQKPDLVNKGRTLDLVVDGKVTKTYDLVSQGLWDAFKGRPEAQENLLQSAAARKIKDEANEALKNADRIYSEQAPLSRVENEAIKALANNDTLLMKRIVSNVTIRESVLRMLSSALSFPGKPYRDFSGLAAMSEYDPRAKLVAENILRYAPEYMLKNANIPAEFKDIQFGKDPAVATNPYTAVGLEAEIRNFIRADITDRKLVIVDSIDDLLNSGTPEVQALGEAIQAKGAYGVAQGGVAYLIANRIQQGQGRAKFMHEVGAHLGLENLLPTVVYDRLVDQIATWAGSNNNSLEAQLAAKAKARVGYAKTPTVDEREELLAYFIEEAMLAGVDPTAAGKESGPLMAWFRTLWAAFKVAIRKLGFKPETLQARDVVNMAFGAARLEMNGFWHGTAATFRKFNNVFMNSGEGAQAYGWGSYLAQSVGIGKGYWLADINRKQRGGYEQSLTPYIDYTFALDVVNPENYVLEIYKGLELSKSNIPAIARRLADLGVDYVELAGPDGKISTVQVGGPPGNLMRVDIAVSNDEMLNWDAPFANQPEIVRDFVKGEVATIKDLNDNKGANIRIKTGEDIYKYLVARFWNESKGTGTWKDASASQRMLVKEKASKYLESKGIQGIRYLDAESRENTLDNISFTKDGKTIKSRAGLLQTYFTPGEIVQGYGGPDKVIKFDPVKELITVIAVDNNGNPRRGERERTHFTIPSAAIVIGVLRARGYVGSATNRTRNFVIFNEKNIQRVGSETAADKERMKFGVNAPTQGTIQRNIAKLPRAVQQPARLSLGAIGDAVNKGLDYVVFTSDLVDRATKSGVSSAKKFVDLVGKSKSEARENEIAVEKISDMYALVPEKDRGTGNGSVNRFLFDSTREGKWGYGKYRNDDMGARFDALSPESQAYVEAVFAHGSDMLAKKKKLVLDSTNSEYDAMIAAAKADGDTANEVKLTKEKEATLKRFQTLFKIRDGIPYAPIKRNGSHVVIAKSKEYLAAEAANDTKKITELESNSDHYHVSFTDGKWEARTLQQDLNDQGFFDDVQIAERDTVIDEMFSGHSALRELTKMRSRVDAQAKNGDKSSSKMLSLISQMYLEALAEGSARKSEMRRRGVAGEVDMIRSFAQQGRADANFMASIKYNPQVQDALQEMRNQVKKGDRERKSEIFNELAKRYVQSLDYAERPWLNKLTRMSSLYFLATSPAYYLQNLTQPWMMSVPAMAGKHNYSQASTALFKAYTELGGVMKSAKLLKQQFDFNKVPSDVRDAIKELVNRGKIDIGLDTEMGEFKVEGDGYFAGKISAADKALRLAVQKVESINRLSTAMAAYRLELAKTGNKQEAINYADRILTETHGDYTSFNAPRAFNTGVGKVALQFRKFQLIQLSFYAKLIKDALQGADRAAALKTLAYSLGHTGLLAGAMGMPGYAAIAWAINALLSDEDDKYDLTYELRKAIGDEDVANLILRGAPTLVGADISGKVGAGNMLSIMPFSQADLSTTAGRAEAFGTLIGGASLGMASRMIDGLGLMMSGDWHRGLEQTMPKGVADAMKAYRIANEGMTRRNGDIILPPDEVSAMDTLFQAIGVQPVKQTVTYERQTLMKETTQNFTERTTKIKNDYVKAARNGDSEAQGEAREAWKALQEAKKRNGVNTTPLSELLKAPAEQKKREKMTVGGVQYTKGTRKLAEEIAGD